MTTIFRTIYQSCLYSIVYYVNHGYVYHRDDLISRLIDS